MRQERNRSYRVSCRHTVASRNKAAWLFLSPSIFGTAVFIVIPFGDVFRRSLMDSLGKRFVGFVNYQQVLRNEAFLSACKNTIHFLVVCIPALLLVSLGIALLFSTVLLYDRQEKSRKLVSLAKSLFLLPYALPIASIVMVWQLLFAQHGLINGILERAAVFFHLSIAGNIDWMNQSSAFYILCVCYVWKNMGYYLILWIAAINEIGMDVMEAAKVDGASVCQCIRYIYLPALTRSARLFAVLALIACFRSYREAYLVAGDYPDQSIYILQHVFNNWLTVLDIPKMSAGAVLLVLVIATLFLILMRRGKKDRT